ncbi:MAG: hypothetical protein HQL36_02920, partial [Alphaproteobacteria bacterium]|nr:hypothetical protein [Alphaproteobacteria bacterium]
MDQETDRTGPKRVGGMISDLFEYVLEHGSRIDRAMADESLRMASARIQDICATCQKGGVAEAPEHVPEAPGGHEQRSFFLLRLASCKLSYAYKLSDADEGIDRRSSVGLDAYIRHIVPEATYGILNEQARHILAVSGDTDNQILESVHRNYLPRLFLNNILIRFGLSFADFKP